MCAIRFAIYLNFRFERIHRHREAFPVRKMATIVNISVFERKKKKRKKLINPSDSKKPCVVLENNSPIRKQYSDTETTWMLRRSNNVCIVNGAVLIFSLQFGSCNSNNNNNNLFETSDKFQLIRKNRRRQCTSRCIKLSIVEITKASESIVGEQA